MFRQNNSTVASEQRYEAARSAYKEALDRVLNHPTGTDAEWADAIHAVRVARAEMNAADSDRDVFALTAMGEAAMKEIKNA